MFPPAGSFLSNYDSGETKLNYWQKAEMHLNYDFISQLNWLRICLWLKEKCDISCGAVT